MPDIQTIKDGIVQGWVTWIITAAISYAVVWLCYGILHALGRDGQMLKERRKYFFLLSSVLLFVGISVLQHLSGQLSDIRTALSKNGSFKAAVIFAGVVGSGIEATNISTGTFSSENASTTKAGSGVNTIFIIRVVNPGADSVAWNWKAKLVLSEGGTILEGTIPSVVGIQPTILTTRIGPYPINMDDNLLQTMSLHKLASGDATMGWINVHINGIDTIPNGSRFVITFDNAFGNQTRVDDVWDATK